MPDVCRLAAAYAVGQAKNHPFGDGCERTDYAAMALLFALNGRTLSADNASRQLTFLAVAAREIDEAGLAAWLREHCLPR